MKEVLTEEIRMKPKKRFRGTNGVMYTLWYGVGSSGKPIYNITKEGETPDVGYYKLDAIPILKMAPKGTFPHEIENLGTIHETMNEGASMDSFAKDFESKINKAVGAKDAFEVKHTLGGRWTRGDNIRHSDPRVRVELNKESQYLKKMPVEQIVKSAVDFVKTLGQSKTMTGPLESDSREVVKIGSYYVILKYIKNWASFDIVTKNKFRGAHSMDEQEFEDAPEWGPKDAERVDKLLNKHAEKNLRDWWDKESTPEQRKKMLEAAGIDDVLYFHEEFRNLPIHVAERIAHVFNLPMNEHHNPIDKLLLESFTRTEENDIERIVRRAVENELKKQFKTTATKRMVKEITKASLVNLYRALWLKRSIWMSQL